MNHSRERLDDCIFDYLASKPNRYINYRQIFDDIRGETGHRCSDLSETYEDRKYFIAVCNILNNRFKNIRKYYQDHDMYLGFEKGAIDSNVEKYKTNPWPNMSISTIIGKVFSDDMHRDFETDYYYQTFEKEPLLHEMIRYGVTNSVIQDLIRSKHLNTDLRNDRDQTLLDVAILVKNTDMITFLVRYIDEQNHIDVMTKLSKRTPVIIDRSSIHMDTCRFCLISFALGFGFQTSYVMWSVLTSLF